MIDFKKITLEAVARTAGLKPEEVTSEMDLVADLGIDSMKAMDLLIDLEDRLDIEISDADAAMDTVDELIQAVEALYRAKPVLS